MFWRCAPGFDRGDRGCSRLTGATVLETLAAVDVVVTNARLPRPHLVRRLQNCDAVRAAGKAPLYPGQPCYSLKLDRDRDGIACEP
jgi:hypothetical protein